MFFLNLAFFLLTLVLLTLVCVEAEYDVGHGRMLADAEIALSVRQPVSTAQLPILMRSKQIR